MTDEPTHIATAAAALDDLYAALSQHQFGDGDDIAAVYDISSDLAAKAMRVISSNDPSIHGLLQEFFESLRTTGLVRSPERDAEVRRAALEEAAQEADDWFYDAEKDCVTECRLGNAIRALIDPPPRDADTCATDGCTNPAVIRLDDRHLCRDCYATHDFGDPRMTLDLAKLRAETLALIDGATPGPWWTDGKYDGRNMGCAIIAARADAGPLPGNPTRGMVAFSSAIMNTQARGCEANARLIAAAPTLAADTLRLLDEIERLKRALVETAIPLEAMILAAQDERTGRRLYGELWDGVVAGAKAARAALAEGGPDDR